MPARIYSITDEEIINMLNSGMLEVTLEDDSPVLFCGKPKA